jgi:hypothetical protein
MTATSATKQSKKKSGPKSGVNNKLAGREIPDQPDLALTEEEPPKGNEQEELPPAIVEGRTAVNFLRPHFEHDAKLDKRTVGIELSLELRDEHEEFVPKEVKRFWKLVKQGGVKSISMTEIGHQYIELGLAPEGDDRDLELKVAEIEKAALTVVEEKGSGEATEVVRFSFRIIAVLDAELEKFVCRQFGKTLWLKMVPVQGSLLE